MALLPTSLSEQHPYTRQPQLMSRLSGLCRLCRLNSWSRLEIFCKFRSTLLVQTLSFAGKFSKTSFLPTL